MIYFDTSFLAPLIREEATSAEVERFMRGLPVGELALSHWTRVEFASPRAAAQGEGRDMCSACYYAQHMSKMIQIRNVPDRLHRRLKARAAVAGMSLSDYLLNEIRRAAERPTVEELRARLERRPAVRSAAPPAQVVRAERDSR